MSETEVLLMLLLLLVVAQMSRVLPARLWNLLFNAQMPEAWNLLFKTQMPEMQLPKMFVPRKLMPRMYGIMLVLLPSMSSMAMVLLWRRE